MLRKLFTPVLFYLPLLISFSNCKRPVFYTDKKPLLAYLNDKNNGLIQDKPVLGVIYSLKYKPKELIIAQDLQNNPGYKPDSLKQTYSDCLYFVLSVSRDSSEIFSRLSENYTELLKKITFGLNDQVRLITDESKTIFYLKDFIYPRLYGTTPSTSILLCFKDKALASPTGYTVYIKDFINESGDELKFKFSKSDIDNIPGLKL